MSSSIGAWAIETTFVATDALRGGRRPLHHVGPRQADDGEPEASHRLVLARVAAARRGRAVELVAVGLDDELHSGQRKSGVQMPIRMFTCGRGMPWAAHMRRKRSSRTERTAAGSTAPGEDPPKLRVPAPPRPRDHLRRERRRRHVEVDLGLFEGPEQPLREATAARSRSVRIGVVTGIPRCVVTCAAGSRWRWTRMPSRRRCPAVVGTVTSVTAPPRSMPHSAAAAVWLSTAPSPSASTPACHPDSRSAGT